MCERYKNISFLYYCDVNDIIDRTHTHKNNKIEQEQEVNSFFYGYEPTDIELFPLLLNVAHS